MTRINTNIASMIAQQNLARSNTDLATRLERLSTGLRINRGSDDPAGLIISERLRGEMKGIDQAIDNSQRASSVISTTEAYLSEVADLLISLKGLVVESANTGGFSAEEIEANQLQIDSALDAITRIANTASFGGRNLLDGSMDYHVEGVNSSALDQVDIHAARFNGNPSIGVSVEVTSAAEQAELVISASTSGFEGTLEADLTLEVAGTTGIETLSFVQGTSMSDVVSAINTVTGSTGVTAALVDAGDESQGVTVSSQGYGEANFVSLRGLGESGEWFQSLDGVGGGPLSRDEGADVQGTINGMSAVGRGLELSINTHSLAMKTTLDAAFATTVDGIASSFEIAGGGVVFQLGPDASANHQVGFAVQSIASSALGATMVGDSWAYLDAVRTGGEHGLVSGGAQGAEQIIDAAIDEIAVLRGRLGAFERNTLQTNMRSLQIGLENLASSESSIRDADFAAETAALTRAQILTQAGTSVLAIANAQSQNVLALLG